jgi:hypothetical protein
MTERLHPTDPRVRVALDEFADEFGIRIDRVLLPTHWAVHLINGRPEITLNPDGMRALALVAPRPDAPQLVEDLLRRAEEALRGDRP